MKAPAIPIFEVGGPLGDISKNTRDINYITPSPGLTMKKTKDSLDKQRGIVSISKKNIPIVLILLWAGSSAVK